MVEIALGAPIDELFPRIQRADRRRLHRAGPQGPDPHGGGRAITVAVKVVRPGVREGFARDLQAMRAAARLFERMVPDARRLQAGRDRRRAGALRRRSRWICASRPRPCPSWRRIPQDDPDFRVPKPEWELTARDVLTIDVDRRHPPQRRRGHRGARASTAARSGAPSSSPSCAMRSATASSTPTCIPAICSWTSRAGSWPSISASWAGSA